MKVEWAGYDNDGNDRSGHLHVHPEGAFIRSDLVVGFYCHAPLDENGECSDPPRLPEPGDADVDFLKAVFGVETDAELQETLDLFTRERS